MTLPLRASSALAATVLCVTGLGAQALADRPITPEVTALAGAAGVAAMQTIESQIGDSILQGHVTPIYYGSSARTPGDVVGTEGWGDSGLWTGVYLGGQSLRYATARDYLERKRKPKLTKDEVAFWTAQRDQALSRVRDMLAAQHRDITIAQDWTGSLQVPPHVNTDNPGGTHAADFGGGVIKGEAGMIMRACTLKGSGALGVVDPHIDPAKPVNSHSNRVFTITWSSGDGKTYNCETSPSRDTYAGLTFGLLTAYDLVGPDEPALRNQIRTDLVAMGNFLHKYAWNYPRPHGYVSAKHDFDGAISPLMVYVPMARLNMTNAVRHVAADPADKLKWDAIWAQDLATEGPQLAASLEIDSLQPNDGYYKFNLHHLTSFNLLRTTSGVERQLFAQAVGVMDKTTRDDINAHFEAITFALTGDAPRRDAAVTHLGEWLDYRAATESGPISNSPKCGTSIVCVPKDQYDLDVEQAPGGTVTWFPGQPHLPPVSKAGEPRAQRPIPVAIRPPTDFLWQRPPTALDGDQGATHRNPGIDYLTPYWMIRYFSEVAPPAASPFPVWAGPAHL